MKKIIISPKEKGKYKAFPTVVKSNGEIIIAYREGFVDTSKPHGKNGCVKILKSKDLKMWQSFETPFCDNELDAILSGPFDNEFVLVTRSYEYKKRNESYVSRFKTDSLPKKRIKVEFENVTLSAFFGHMFEFNGELTATAYGIANNSPTPLILSSNNHGESFAVKSIVTPNGFNHELNETSIEKSGDKFLVVMRSREPSYDLYYSLSSDLVVWDKPKKIGLLGHAPVVKKLQNGRFALVFRDLNGDLPGVGLALSSKGTDWEYTNLCYYTGNLYNGGYADFVELEPNRLFVVYYAADEDNEPWIEAQIVEL